MLNSHRAPGVVCILIFSILVLTQNVNILSNNTHTHKQNNCFIVVLNNKDKLEYTQTEKVYKNEASDGF